MIQFAVITVAGANKKKFATRERKKRERTGYKKRKVNHQLGVFIFISMYSSSAPNGPISSPSLLNKYCWNYRLNS